MATLALRNEHPPLGELEIRADEDRGLPYGAAHPTPSLPPWPDPANAGTPPINSSTSAGSRIFGNVRGVRTKGVPRSVRDRFRFDKPRGTGFVSTSPHANKNPNNPEIDDKRRWIVRADSPDSPSANRTTRRSPRWIVMNSNTSAVVTFSGSLATTEKNTFKS